MGGSQSSDVNISSLTAEEIINQKCLAVYKNALKKYGDEILQLKDFEKLFDTDRNTFGKVLTDHIRSYSGATISADIFLKLGLEIFELRDGRGLLEYYFNIFSCGRKVLTFEEFSTMVNMCYNVALDVSHFSHDANSTNLACLSSGMIKSLGSVDSISCDEFVSWGNRNLSGIFYGVQCWTSGIFTDINFKEKKLKGKNASGLQSVISKSSLLLSSPILWLMSCILPYVYRRTPSNNPSTENEGNGIQDPYNKIDELNHWVKLFDSNVDGLSISRFIHHVFDYKSPTVILLELEDNYLYCISSDEEWKENPKRWGGESCVAYQLRPQFKKVLSGSGMFFMNLQLKSLPKGIQIGKDVKTLIIYIDEDMYKCEHYGVPLKIERLEVWGCGGIEAIDEQQRQRAWEKKDTEKNKNKKLNAAENWEDSPDRMLLGWGGVRADYSKEIQQAPPLNDTGGDGDEKS